MSADLLDTLDFERALLGAALLDPGVATELADTVRPADFAAHHHGWIWEALVDTGLQADAITIADHLERGGHLADAGGMGYLSRLLGEVPTSLNAGAYAALVARDSRRRRLFTMALAAANSARRADCDPDALAAQLERDMRGLGTTARAEIGTMQTAVDEWYEGFETFIRTGDIPGLTTGFPLLDKKTLGLKRRELMVLAARPSMGKTSLAAQMSVKQARGGLRVAVFALEPSKAGWVEAAALAELGIDKTRATADVLERVHAKCAEIYNLPIRFYELGYSSMGEIEQAARQMERELGGLDVIYVDHLGYVDHQRGEKTTNLPYLIGQTTKRLARISKDMNAAVVCLCQLNRASAVTKAEPQLTDLRDSGEIEQDARQVWFIHREGYYADPEPPADKPQEARILVRKNHEGPTGLIKLAFVKACRRFAEFTLP